MELTERDELILAYYLDSDAQNLKMVTRFWPYGELVLIIDDKIQVVTRKFRMRGRTACSNAAHAFQDIMIERGGFSTVKNEYGGTMHQYQADKYRQIVQELRETNPIIARAKEGGAEFWAEAFAEVEERMRN